MIRLPAPRVDRRGSGRLHSPNNTFSPEPEDPSMSKKSALIAMLPIALFASAGTAQQYPLLDKVAAKVIAKYQSSTCEQLFEQKSQPKSPEEQKFVQLLQSDPRLQQAFFAQVAAPIASRLFSCGLIP